MGPLLASIPPLVGGAVKMVMRAERAMAISMNNPEKVHGYLKGNSPANAIVITKYGVTNATFERAEGILENLRPSLFINDGYEVLLLGCKEKNLANDEIFEVVEKKGFMVMKVEVKGDLVTFMMMSYKGALELNEEQVTAILIKNGCLVKDSKGDLLYAIPSCGNLGRGEAEHLPRPDYMDAQFDVNPKMRAILVDWLVEVHMKYKLKMETLFLTINLIDRFLDKRQTSRKKLQLVGVTTMLIAAKFEEIYPPEIRDFVYITDNAYTKEDILMMEVSILTALKFVLCVPTVAHFLERYQRINHCAEAHRHLMQYLLELSLLEYKMIRYAPSHLAAAALFLRDRKSVV